MMGAGDSSRLMNQVAKEHTDAGECIQMYTGFNLSNGGPQLSRRGLMHLEK